MRLRHIRRHKKGGLQISINAIVILILAITVLGLGLSFIKNMMGGTMNQLGAVSEDIKNEMINRLKTSNERLAFRENEITVGKNQKKTLYYGIKNEEASQSFTVKFSCEDAMDHSANYDDAIDFTYFDTTGDIEKDGVKVFPVGIKPKATTTSTTYMCVADINSGNKGYASKTFYVTVI